MVTTRLSGVRIGPTLNGRNGEGDRYYTDGEIWMAVLAVAGEKTDAASDRAGQPGAGCGEGCDLECCCGHIAELIEISCGASACLRTSRDCLLGQSSLGDKA